MHSRVISLYRVFLTFALLATSLSFSSHSVLADSFDWQSINGSNWASTVKSQFGGTCWDFSSCGCIEAKYMLTRNDPSFVPDVSEQQLCWETAPDLGGTGGGSGQAVLNYFTTHGVVSEAECPTQGTDVGSAPYWPLATGWQNRVFKSTSNVDAFAGGVGAATTAMMKSYLMKYGPLEVGCCGNSPDLFDSVAAVEAYTGGPTSQMGHEVSLVGYVDDPNMANGCGGYWIIKNSWGTTAGNGTGYYYAPYNNIEFHGDLSAITGAVYYTGPMYHVGASGTPGTDYTGTAATNTWKGTASGTWDTTAGTSGNWSNNATGTSFTWVNQELQAVFDSTASRKAITVSGAVIAHGLTISTSGYSFAPADSSSYLTITAAESPAPTMSHSRRRCLSVVRNRGT